MWKKPEKMGVFHDQCRFFPAGRNLSKGARATYVEGVPGETRGKKSDPVAGH